MEEDKKQVRDESAAGAEFQALKTELEKTKKEKNDYLAGWQRAKADFINYKKDEMKRFEDIAVLANETLLRDLIGVLDSFDLGLEVLEKKGPVEKGIYMIKLQLAETLKKYGLEKIDVKKGDLFDPKIAEAISEIESDKPPQTILEEIESGYRLGNRIIRPVKVKISKGQNKDK